MRRNTPTLNQFSQYLLGKILFLSTLLIHLERQEINDLSPDRILTTTKSVGRLEDKLG